MRLRLASRGSALAVLQTSLVARALQTRWPALDIQRLTRASHGDRDLSAELWTQRDPGIFTADLSRALVDDEADVVVHSWKDLPLVGYPGTEVAATLERADPRDVLLVRRAATERRRPEFVILSSSPRRVWQLETAIARLLPWPVTAIRPIPVRGNIPTRIEKLLAGDADALVVAKAALDRLLSEDAAAATVVAIRAALDLCDWMVLPLREFPTAPAQGALALEIASNRQDVADCVRAINHEPTWSAVASERQILESFGGGCHAAIGATVLIREYGRVTSVRAKTAATSTEATWSLTASGSSVPPRVDSDLMWPRPTERDGARRRPLDVPPPVDADGLWVARADALSKDWRPQGRSIVWVAGSRTWERLAARGVWVNGSADGLGDTESPDVDGLAGHHIEWRRLTHNRSADPNALATYVVDQDLPGDLDRRTHFFWTSGSLFVEALTAFPSIRDGWHASGPGRTSRVIRDTLGATARTSVWLDYDQWHHAVTL